MNVVYVVEKMMLMWEMYFVIMFDRVSVGLLVIVSAEGGTSIEDLA